MHRKPVILPPGPFEPQMPEISKWFAASPPGDAI
jgi:hypothetical protein